MNRALLLAFMVSLASFTLSAQEQEGFVAKVSTGLGFDSFISTLEVTYHPLVNLGDAIVGEDARDNYTWGIEEEFKKKSLATKLEVDSFVFNPEEVVYEPLKYKALNPFGYGSSNWYFDRSALLFAIRYYYGGMSFQDRSPDDESINLLYDQNFFPNGDRRYANMIIINTIAREIVAELTIDQVNALPEKRNVDEKEGYIPLYKKTVDEAYGLISIEHDSKGFDFLIYPADIESATQILQGKIGNPTLQQKMIEAKRQKLISYIKWTYTNPRTMEALKILAFVLKFEGIPDVNPSLVVNWAREIAEWRLANPNGLWRSYFKDLMKQAVPKKVVYWPDLYFGARLNAYGSTVADAMGKVGFGYNFGESFVYATGYIGLPTDGTSLKYEANIASNIRFVDFFELRTCAYYYDTGRLRFVLNPNFVLFNFLEIGGGLDFDVLPEASFDVFGEVFITKYVGIGIQYGITSGDTSLTATIKF